MCILHVHPHGVTCLGRLVAQVTILRREDNVLSFNVSLNMNLGLASLSAHTATPTLIHFLYISFRKVIKFLMCHVGFVWV